MKGVEKNKGITLVALVVTIIVLIILAGISMNLILGDNGIITKAKEAKLYTELTGIIENIRIDIMENVMKKASKNEDMTVTNTELASILDKYRRCRI